MLRESVEEAVYLYSDSILRVAYSYVKNTHDAEDIVQEVFMALLKCEKMFESQEHMKAWLMRVAINKSKNHLKSSWTSKRVEMPDAIPILEECETELLNAVFCLEEKYRIPIYLFYYEGYSIKEISKIMGRPVPTIGSRLRRGREKLKSYLSCDDHKR